MVHTHLHCHRVDFVSKWRRVLHAMVFSYKFINSFFNNVTLLIVERLHPLVNRCFLFFLEHLRPTIFSSSFLCFRIDEEILSMASLDHWQLLLQVHCEAHGSCNSAQRTWHSSPYMAAILNKSFVTSTDTYPLSWSVIAVQPSFTKMLSEIHRTKSRHCLTLVVSGIYCQRDLRDCSSRTVVLTPPLFSGTED